MSKALPRPRRRMDAATFFSDYLPELWLNFSAEHAWAWPAGQVEIAVQVEPDAGLPAAEFAVVAAGGTVRGRPGAAAAPLVRIHCSQDAWHVFVSDVVPMLLDYTEAHLPKAHAGIQMASAQATPERLRSIEQKSGVVHLHYIDDAGDVAEFSLNVGTGVGPEATVQVKDTDLQAVLDAFAADDRSAAVARLLRSRIQLEGDAAYVVRLLQS